MDAVARSLKYARRSVLLLLLAPGCTMPGGPRGHVPRADLDDAAGRARVDLECDSCRPGRSRDLRFGLLGPLFSDPRLHAGTAFPPWQYVFNLGLSASQCANTVLGGDPDESLSSRLGRAQADGVWPVNYALAPVVDVVLGPDHCEQCVEWDEQFEQELWAW